MTVETRSGTRRSEAKRRSQEAAAARRRRREPPADEPETPPDRRGATRALAVLACACLVPAVGCVALWHQSAHDRAVERAREDGAAAAQSEAKDVLSYNFRTLDYDLSKARSEMTPGMARSFDDYWRIFRPSVDKSQTQALTQVQVTGVTDATPTRVEVVLFVKMISVNAAHKEPQVDTSWPRFQLRKVGRKWLIDGPRMTAPPPASSTPAPSGKPSAKPTAKPSTKPSKKH